MTARRSPRPRRERSLVETLLSIVLVLETCAVFFAALAIFGLDRLDPDWLALVYGAALMLVFIATAGVQRHGWGVWFGAALQLVLIAIGFLEPMMFLLGAGFAALWVYCYLRGRQIDARKAAWRAAQTEAEGETGGADSASVPTPTEGDQA